MSDMQGGIVNPHEHDVLSGRGNFVNYHAGNEHFRALVRKHKVAYVACPKPQKGKFSRLIVDEIRARNPPGRFLKQDPTTKLWFDIGEKKALDKTRQALREGAPEIMKEIAPGEEANGEGAAAQKAVPKSLELNMGGGAMAAHPGNPMMQGAGGIGGFGAGGIPNNYQGGPDLHRKLAGMYQSHDEEGSDDYEDQFEPRPIDPRLQQQFGGQPQLGQFMGAQQGLGDRPGLQKQSSDNSIKVEKVFIGGGESALGKAPKQNNMQGSSLSVMSLSMSDFVKPGDGDVGDSNLSDMFSSSVKIQDGESKRTVGSKDKSKQMDKSTPSLLDMSVATIGDNMSEFGNSIQMKADLGESVNNMSFSKVFEE